MKKRILISLAIAIVAIAIVIFYLLKSPATAHLEKLVLQNGETLQVINHNNPEKRILIITTADTSLTSAQLLQLGNSGNFQIFTLTLSPQDCLKQQQLFISSLRELGKIDIVAAIGAASHLPLTWLASQQDSHTVGLSVGFSVAKNNCLLPLPKKTIQGHWLVAWNDNPDDATALYTQQQNNTQTLIGNYDNSLPELLVLQLNRLLQGNTNNFPLIEIKPTDTTKDIAIIFYSGDGGWRDLDRDVGQQLADLGYPVIGVDTLRYYWQRKEPSQAAADLATIMDKYRNNWHIKHFVLTGFSFGADVMPALYNRLTPQEQQQILAVQLLAFSRGVNYEIKVAGWVTNTQTEALTGPEVAKIPAKKLLCITGTDEAKDSGCTLPSMSGKLVILPGGHHFDKNYPALAKRLVTHFTANLTNYNLE